MGRVLFPLVILCFLISEGQGIGANSFAPSGGVYYPNDIDVATGNVVASARNTIEIFDEQKKEIRGFVYLGEEQFQKDEYIRVYYHPDTNLVVRIKKMTVLEYKENSQNLGYISRQSPPMR